MGLNICPLQSGVVYSMSAEKLAEQGHLLSYE